MFLINKCSLSTMKSYHLLFSPQASMSSKNPQIQQVVSEGIRGFSFIKACFLMSFNSKNFDLLNLENQSFNVSMVNFSLIENSSIERWIFHALKQR